MLNPQETPEFDINKAYALYLKKMKLDESKMHPIQRIETKRAFMGGLAYMMKIMMLSATYEDQKWQGKRDQYADGFSTMHDQCEDYWREQALFG